MPWSATDELLVIGYGNRLRGDDGAGPAVAEALRSTGAVAMPCHQLLPELAETISGYRRLVLVDACADSAPGVVRWQALSPPTEAQVVPIHSFDAPALLAMAAMLYGRTPATLLITIGGQQWDEPDVLSAPVRQAVERVCRELPQRLAER